MRRLQPTIAAAAASVVLLLLPIAAEAQAVAATTPRAGVSAQPGLLKRWDAAGTLGWFNVRNDPSGQYNRWFNEILFAGVSVGRYWTDHLKTEVDVGRTTTGQINQWGAPVSGPQGCCVYTTQSFSDVKISIGQVYQWGHNAWVHPFVGAGLDLDREWSREQTPAQQIPLAGSYPYTYVDVPASERTTATWRPKVFALAGLKAYLSQHVFFRTDIRVSAASGRRQVTARAGFGADF